MSLDNLNKNINSETVNIDTIVKDYNFIYWYFQQLNPDARLTESTGRLKDPCQSKHCVSWTNQKDTSSGKRKKLRKEIVG